MKDWHVELLTDVLLDFALKAVENRVTQRTRRDHGLSTAGLGRQDVLPCQLDGHSLVVGGGVETTALAAAAVVDRSAAQHFRELLQRGVVAGIDEAVLQRRARDVASVKCPYRKVRERI